MKKKTVALIGTLALTVSMATAAFAATYTNPADLVSELTGKAQTDVYQERTEGKTYGQIAEENGVLDEFKDKMFEYKKEIIDQRVTDGVITEEDGIAIKAAMEERIATCTGTPAADRERLGQKFGGGLGFGKGQGMGQGQMQGRGMGQRGQGMGFGR